MELQESSCSHQSHVSHVHNSTSIHWGLLGTHLCTDGCPILKLHFSLMCVLLAQLQSQNALVISFLDVVNKIIPHPVSFAEAKLWGNQCLLSHSHQSRPSITPAPPKTLFFHAESVKHQPYAGLRVLMVHVPAPSQSHWVTLVSQVTGENA